MHLLEATTYNTKTAAIFAVDMEKAFDSLEWTFLFYVMRRMGLGPGFVGWTALLYTEVTARVKTGDLISGECRIGRGTCQGCPLSPLLFALAVEPLAARARLGEAFHGLMAYGHTH